MNGNEELQTEALYKRFKSILDKLSPHNFNTSLDEMKTLNINSQQRLEGIVDLIYEKALEVPDPRGYAILCNKLSMLKVPADNATSEGQCVNFRALIISRCQKHFVEVLRHRHCNTDNKEIDEAGEKAEEHLGKVETDMQPAEGPDSNELARMLAEEEKVLKRSLGNVRFIGELYKLKMLTAKIMVYCVNALVDGDGNSLECLCELLTVPGFGEQLDGEVREPLNNLFSKMQEIVERGYWKLKRNTVNNRVRSLMREVIELRKMKWIPKTDPQLSLPRTSDPYQMFIDTQHVTNEQQQQHKKIISKMPKKNNALNIDGKKNNPPMMFDKWKNYRARGDRRQNTPTIVDKKREYQYTPTIVDERKNNPPMTNDQRKNYQTRMAVERQNNAATIVDENTKNHPKNNQPMKNDKRKYYQRRMAVERQNNAATIVDENTKNHPKNNQPMTNDKRKYCQRRMAVERQNNAATIVDENTKNHPKNNQPMTNDKRKYYQPRTAVERQNNAATIVDENTKNNPENNQPMINENREEDDFMRVAMTAILGEADKFLKQAKMIPLQQDSKVYNCLNEIRRLALQHSGLAKATVDVRVQVEKEVVTHETCAGEATNDSITSVGDVNESEQLLEVASASQIVLTCKHTDEMVGINSLISTHNKCPSFLESEQDIIAHNDCAEIFKIKTKKSTDSTLELEAHSELKH